LKKNLLRRDESLALRAERLGRPEPDALDGAGCPGGNPASDKILRTFYEYDVLVMKHRACRRPCVPATALNEETSHEYFRCFLLNNLILQI
jgi:hypothetical protein